MKHPGPIPLNYRPKRVRRRRRRTMLIPTDGQREAIRFVVCVVGMLIIAAVTYALVSLVV